MLVIHKYRLRHYNVSCAGLAIIDFLFGILYVMLRILFSHLNIITLGANSIGLDYYKGNFFRNKNINTLVNCRGMKRKLNFVDMPT